MDEKICDRIQVFRTWAVICHDHDWCYYTINLDEAKFEAEMHREEMHNEQLSN